MNGAPKRKQIVNADGLVTFESVHRRLGIQLAFQPLQRRIQRVGQCGVERILDNREPVALHALDVGVSGDLIHFVPSNLRNIC